MDTRFLETFLAVAESGSVAAAARRLNLTAAGVAQRLRALEAEIGVPLLKRAGRSLAPTPAGARIAARAPELLVQLRDLAALATADALAGELRLGAVPTAIIGLLPDMMTAMRERHPRIEIRIVPGRSEELFARVAEGALDAALIVQPPFEIPKSCGWAMLRREPLIVLAPGRLAGAEPLHLLSAEPFIRYDEASWGGQLASAYLRRRRIRPREAFELVTLDAIAVLVDRGLGVSLVPDWAPPWPEGLSLARLPVPDAPVRCMGLAWGRASPRIRLIEALAGQAMAG
ncbi:LysR family transcriptional regulator [Roseomonas sp. SSH11]|uniref:LysR family transcriptional regulator n=1 Tax=Pararoseomonas baculiformis TaxID=2820812 RepID=A0ABS4AHH6_9PROT|nr:LysR family transcriptional regulator [Pararoseomonas baculiformis]MBP0445973.1 LysR family transcriptional regulator [Pararoseomonas baculiformis]